MAAAAPVSFLALSAVPHRLRHRTLSPLLPTSQSIGRGRCSSSSVFPSSLVLPFRLIRKRRPCYIRLSAANKPSPSTEISSTVKIRSEVLSPFRSVRMFFYLAFIASGSLGGLISLAQLVPALINTSRAANLPETLKGFGIDLGAVLFFAFLYTRENKAKNAQIAKLSREESLSKLKLRVDDNKTISVGDLRGVARLVILAGPVSYITDSFLRSKPYVEGLVERGVLVVPFATDGNAPRFEFEVIGDEDQKAVNRKKRLWQLTPLYISEWAKWVEEQKKLANVELDSPVYLSLRMDGRVRGSGVGCPPWNALVAQLPPVQGLWTGLLDGMDGRVL